jgi:hypothetical protein
MNHGKMNELGWEYKTKKERTEQQNSKKRRSIKLKILKKWRWNKKRSIKEHSKKGSLKEVLLWMD